MDERFDCVKEYEDREPGLDKQGETASCFSIC